MTYLFIFAHPDDETVACAGTISRLLKAGERVIVVSVTDGSAGEVIESAKELYGAMATPDIRKLEFENVMTHLEVQEFKIMNFADGTINNIQVWGQLKESIIALFNEYRPDFVITFDHSGWYYHLDHVGVSIATTLAYHDEKTSVKALLYSHFRPGTGKWNYNYSEEMPVTHEVQVLDLQHKLTACELHKSQELSTVKNYLTLYPEHYELYEWGFGTEEYKKQLHPLFCEKRTRKTNS